MSAMKLDLMEFEEMSNDTYEIDHEKLLFRQISSAYLTAAKLLQKAAEKIIREGGADMHDIAQLLDYANELEGLADDYTE